MRTRQFWGCKCNHVVIHLSADLHDSLFCVNSRICIFVCSMHGTEWWDLLKMPPAHFKCLQANVRGEAVKSSSILIYAECLAWYLLQTEKGKKKYNSGASNVSCDSEVFPSRWHESIFIYSETSTCSAAKVSWQVPPWVPLILGEDGGKERRTGWVGDGSAAVGCGFKAAVSSPGLFMYICTSFTVCIPYCSISDHFCFPGQNAERLLDFGRPEQWRPLHPLV